MTNTTGDGTYLGDLRALIDASGTNKHDQAVVLIEALIGRGIDMRDQIFDTALRLGFKAGHIAHILKEIRRWTLQNGRYRLIEPPTEVKPLPLKF